MSLTWLNLSQAAPAAEKRNDYRQESPPTPINLNVNDWLPIRVEA